MILFLHGTGAISSLWIPVIRDLLRPKVEYSDRDLLKLFTLSLPGHMREDGEFATGDVLREIKQFQAQQYQAQRDFAFRHFNSLPASMGKVLQSPKLNLIGHSVGGILSLDYTFRHLKTVERLALISTGNRFNQLALKSGKYALEADDHARSKIIHKLRFMQRSKKLRERIFYNLILENPQQKGLQSAVNIVQGHHLQEKFDKLSLNDKIFFRTIPILCINGQLDPIVPFWSAGKLLKVLQSKDGLIQTKMKEFSVHGVNQTSLAPIVKKTYSLAGHEPMDDKHQQFILDLQEFMQNY